MSEERGPETTKGKVQLYEVVMPLLKAMYTEFKELSKKKPDGALSKNKIQVVNRLFETCRGILESEASIQFLDILDEDSVPQNSDVVLMLSQYNAAMTQFKNTYYRQAGPGLNADLDWITSAWVTSD